MKKVLLIHHSGDIGGAGVSAINTAISLAKNFDVSIYCPNIPNAFSKLAEERGITVKNYNFPMGSIPFYSGGPRILSPIFWSSILNIFKHKKKWTKILEEEKPSLVIVNSKIMSWFTLITKGTGVKSICYIRETRKKSIFNCWNKIHNILLNKFTGVAFISDYDEKKESLKIPLTAVIPNYVEMGLYTKTSKREILSKQLHIKVDSFNVLFVGGMLRIKGFDCAVKSMKYLKNYNVNLIVAGSPSFVYKDPINIYNKTYNFIKRSYENRINKEIRTYCLEKKIVKLGVLSNMGEAYTIADVLIFPATVPHQARPAFEIGIQKKPVIMPDFENTEEYIIDGYNGLIFRRKNPKSLANSIIKLIEDPALRNRLGENNYKNSKSKHTKENSEKILLSLVNVILEKPEL